MTNPSKSSPESPAKEQPGEQNARERTGYHWWCPKCQREVDWRDDTNEVSVGMAEGQGLHIQCKTKLELRKGSSMLPLKPITAAPDAAAMVKRLRDMVQRARTVRDTLREDGRPHTANIVEDLCKSAEAASAMIEKLGQRIETLQAAHDLGWAHKECPNCGADMMTGAKLGQEWIHGAWDNDAISAMAGAALQSFPKIGYMENATKIVRAVLKTQEEYRSPPPPERP